MNIETLIPTVEALEEGHPVNKKDKDFFSIVDEITITGFSLKDDKCYELLSELLSVAFPNLRTIHLNRIDQVMLAKYIPLFKFSSVTCVSIGEESILYNLTPLTELKQITRLDIDGVRGIDDLTPISELTQLSRLSFGHTSVQDLTPLAGLSKLKQLFMRDTPIHDLSPLEHLTQLTDLSIDNTMVKSLSPLSNHFHMANLSINGTKIEDISPLANSLHSLLANNTLIKDLTPLARQNCLARLSLRQTPIEDLSPLANTADLTDLDISLTRINDLSPLINHTRLRKLIMDNTLVTDLSPISNLPIDEISLCGVHLREIPKSLVEKVNSIKTNNNTSFVKQPSALFDLPKDQILSLYYNQRRIPVREGKVIFLGESGVGKTHTIQRILKQGEKIPSVQESTQGVMIYSYSDKGNNTTIKFWDFGGQEIQQSMHRCFLTERTCYVIVISNRDPDLVMTSAVKWLRTINDFSKQVSIILLINRWNEVPTERHIDEPTLRKNCQRLSQIYYYSAKDDSPNVFQNIIQLITKEVNMLDSVQLELPTSWYAIREELKNSPRNYINLEDYHRICSRHGLGGDNQAMVSMRRWLLRWFNDLGICFSYHDDSECNESELLGYKLLKPDWLTNGIYRLILWGGRYSFSGKISRANIEKVLSETVYRVNGVQIDYNSDEAGYILEVMRKLGRSYQEDDGSEFIPELLYANKPENVEPKDYQTNITYTMKFSWLPKVVLHRLMIALRLWDDSARWLSGFRLRDKGIYLLISSDEDECQINMKIFANEYVEYYKPFHKARLLLVKYAEEMGIEIKKEELSCDINGSIATQDLFTLIWYYIEDHDYKFTVMTQRMYRPERVPVKNLLLPFFNDSICETVGLTVNNTSTVDIIQALNAVEMIYPYYTAETINKLIDDYLDDPRYYAIYEKICAMDNKALSILAVLSINTNDKFASWIQKNGIERKEQIEMKDANLDRKNLQGINRQLYCWAKESNIYQKAVDILDLDTLADALGCNETERYRASCRLLESIWDSHPELGLMPVYSYLSKKEHAGDYYPGYRDHLTHMLKVYLLGLYLYEKDYRLMGKMKEEVFFPVWTLCALWHDIGYLIETEDGTRDSLDTIMTFDEFNEVLSLPLSHIFPVVFPAANESVWKKTNKVQPDIINTLSDCEEKLSIFEQYGESVKLTRTTDNNPILEYYRSMSRLKSDRIYYDHGIVSASFLLFMCDSLCQYLKDTQKYDLIDEEVEKRDELLKNMESFRMMVKEAAKAIALHNIVVPENHLCKEELIKKGVTICNFCIDYETEPFAWLLRTCDEIQCWDRQRFCNPLEDKKTPVTGNVIEFNDNSLHFEFKNSEIEEKTKESLRKVITPFPWFL